MELDLRKTLLLSALLPWTPSFVFRLEMFVGDPPDRDINDLNGSVLAQAGLHNSVISGLVSAVAAPAAFNRQRQLQQSPDGKDLIWPTAGGISRKKHAQHDQSGTSLSEFCI